MVEITKDERAKIKGFYDRYRSNSKQLLDAIVPEVAKLYMRKLREKQPYGKIDPLYDLWPQRNARPSLRMGLVPIEKGWLDPVVRDSGPTARIMVFRSESWHIQFFTKMTGRRYLGTKVSRPQRPTGGKKTLYFWSNRLNREVWPQVSNAPGFEPKADFVRDAAEEANAELRADGIERLKIVLLRTARETAT